MPPGPVLMTMMPNDLGVLAPERTEAEGGQVHGGYGGSGGSAPVAIAQGGNARTRSSDRAIRRLSGGSTYRTHSAGSSGTSRSSGGSSSSHHK